MAELQDLASAMFSRETYGFPCDKIVYDQDGATLKVGLLDGKIVPPFGEKSIRKVRDLPLKDDDIILIGYPKTGCHWTWEILNMIVSGKAQHTQTGKVTCFMEVAPTELLESCPSRRILNTHLWFEYIPKQVSEKKTKIVFTVRNPKDTAVSYYNHHISLAHIYEYKGSFNSWLKLYLDSQVDYGSFFDFYQSWSEAIKNNPDQPILIMSFEDMKEDLPREIRKMAEFLDVSLSDQQVDEIAKAAGFDAMKVAYTKNNNISNTLIRKGQVGDWKNWLTVAQSEMIDGIAKEKLNGTLFSSQRYTI